MRIVIIGGGIAGAHAANTIMEREKGHEVVILSAERYPPYDRIHLCRLVDGSAALEDILLELHPDVNVELNQRVLSIEPEEKKVVTENTLFGYDKLIDLILRYKARLGVFGYDDKLPISAKYYMGGVRTVRGYESGSIGGEENGYRTGGKYTFSNSVEASIPLVESAKMRLAFFFDYGMIGDDNFDDFTRAGTGAVIEWFSPMGPISLVFAYPLMEEDGDKTSNFEFTMGQQF